MTELNVTAIKYFENKVILLGEFKENLNFVLTLNDDISLLEFFSDNILRKKDLIDRNDYLPTLAYHLSEKTATITFAEYSFTFSEDLLPPNDMGKRKQVFSYMRKFKNQISILNKINDQKDKTIKYKSFSDLPADLKKTICSKLNFGEMVPNEIFVNRNHHELQDKTILEAMNTFAKLYGEKNAVDMIINKILGNPFAY